MDNEVAETLMRLSDRALANRSLLHDARKYRQNTFHETELYVAKSLAAFYPLDGYNGYHRRQYSEAYSDTTQELSDDSRSEDDVEMIPQGMDIEACRRYFQRPTPTINEISLDNLCAAAYCQRSVSKPILIRKARSLVVGHVSQEHRYSPTSIEHTNLWSLRQKQPRGHRLGSISSSEDECENGEFDHAHLEEFKQMQISSSRTKHGKSINFKSPDKSVHSDRCIGSYSPEARKKRIERFMEKRKRRVWAKKVDYDVRKKFANSRLRVKGRFVKKEDEELLCHLMSFT